MNKDLVILFEPSIDPVPVERDVVLDRSHFVERLGIPPHRILGDPAASRNAPIGRGTLVRAIGMVLGGAQQFHAHIGAREVVDRQVTRLEQKMRRRTVGNGLAVELDPHPPR